jgi:hypothetical protein
MASTTKVSLYTSGGRGKQGGSAEPLLVASMITRPCNAGRLRDREIRGRNECGPRGDFCVCDLTRRMAPDRSRGDTAGRLGEVPRHSARHGHGKCMPCGARAPGASMKRSVSVQVVTLLTSVARSCRPWWRSERARRFLSTCHENMPRPDGSEMRWYQGLTSDTQVTGERQHPRRKRQRP